MTTSRFNTLFVRIFFLLGGLFFTTFLAGQASVTGYSTYYDDTFNKWIVYTADESKEGIIEQVWPLNNDWSEWSFRLGDYFGTIRSVWQDRFDQWNITIDGETYMARTLYRNDFRTIEIKGGGFLLTMRYDEYDESWATIQSTTRLDLAVVTVRYGDMRDWDLVTPVAEDIPLGLQIASTFVPILLVCPRY